MGNDLFDISGKVAIVTGATDGFGNATSKGLAQAGAKVLLTGRSEKILKELFEEIEKEGYKAAFSVGDPNLHDDVKRAVKDTATKFGGIDILIRAAGFNRPGPIVDQPVE